MLLWIKKIIRLLKRKLVLLILSKIIAIPSL